MCMHICFYYKQCLQFSYHSLAQSYPSIKHTPQIQPPTNYLTILDELRNTCQPNPEFCLNYISYIRTNALEKFAVLCDVVSPKLLPPASQDLQGSQDSQLADDVISGVVWEPLRSPDAAIKYLQRLGKMHWMEETQMTLDIAQYDMQFVTLTPLLHNKAAENAGLQSSYPTAKFKILKSGPGSQPVTGHGGTELPEQVHLYTLDCILMVLLLVGV